MIGPALVLLLLGLGVTGWLIAVSPGADVARAEEERNG